MNNIFILFIALTWGCSELYYENPIEQIVQSETIKDELFLTTVELGEVIQFAIKGWETKNQFSEIYSKKFKSRWEVERCHTSVATGMDYCQWQGESGNCKVYYQDFVGEIEESIDLTQKDGWPFQIMIGGVLYPLDAYFKVQEGVLDATLTITQKMLAHGHDLKFVVLQEEPKESKAGFLKFGKCDGRKRKGFKVFASLDFEIMDGHGFRTLEVSAKREARE